MGKFHELLAVEPDLKGASEKILAETVNTFNKKEGHFKSQVRTYEPVDDEGLRLPDERTEMVTTVGDKLEWTWSQPTPIKPRRVRSGVDQLRTDLWRRGLEYDKTKQLRTVEHFPGEISSYC